MIVGHQYSVLSPAGKPTVFRVNDSTIPRTFTHPTKMSLIIRRTIRRRKMHHLELGPRLHARRSPSRPFSHLQTKGIEFCLTSHSKLDLDLVPRRGVQGKFDGHRRRCRASKDEGKAPA